MKHCASCPSVIHHGGKYCRPCSAAAREARIRKLTVERRSPLRHSSGTWMTEHAKPKVPIRYQYRTDFTLHLEEMKAELQRQLAAGLNIGIRPFDPLFINNRREKTA